MDLPRHFLRALLGRRLPRTSGRLAVPDLDAPVVIRRDRFAIPHVEAESDDGVWYGLGFCQGQDRAFQLDNQLRATRGTLAELMGPRALPVDRLSRRVGFRRAAERQLRILDPATRRVLEAFARGVSAGATVGSPLRAHEFVLLGARPTRYQAADSLAVLKLQAFLLESNWAAELCRLRVLAEDGPEALAALDPASVEDWPGATIGPGAEPGAARRLAEDVARAVQVLGKGGCSNNWAIGGRRTASGRPILANDPHLAPVLPPHWYLAHLSTPEWSVAGASFVGAPGFLAAHNGHAAWGVTASLADSADLFFEEVGPDGRSLREGERFVACETRRESIRVRGGRAHEEVVLMGPRGPVIGPALKGETRALSLRATWLAPRKSEGLIALHRARSFEEMRRALAKGSAVGLSLVYADETGAIAWQLGGDIPDRLRGSGTLPMPGWDAGVGWKDDPVPFDALPWCADPQAGIVASANNPPPSGPATPHLGLDWLDSYRYDRITEVLTSRTDWDVKAVQRLHVDRLSLPWRELREVLLSVSAGDADTRLAVDLLRGWDGDVAPDSAAASVFELFLAEMTRRIAVAKAPRSARWMLGEGVAPLISRSIMSVRRVGHTVRLLRAQPGGWLPRPWADEIADALALAVRRLRARHGTDPGQWAWGRVRPLTLRHPFSGRGLLGRVFDRGPLPLGGDTNTVCQASTDPFEPTADPLYVPSLRMVVDVGDWERCRFALPGGQSGNPFSPHYDDLLAYWQRDDGVPIAWAPEEVARRTVACLTLLPGG